MPNFRYRALTQSGEMVHGVLAAPTLEEVISRIEYLRLLPIEAVAETKSSGSSSVAAGIFNRPRSVEVTTFTRDLALLLKAGARLDDALELLAGDADVGRLRPIVAKVRSSILAGESLADAVSEYATLFPPMYVALVRVGEISGTLDQVLDMLAVERARAEAMRRKLTDAMQYPAFVLVAALAVMLFFILFVLPQFSSVLRDFGAKSDTTLALFIQLSDVLRANGMSILIAVALAIAGIWWLIRRRNGVAAVVGFASRLPGVSRIFQFYRASLFCRNLGVLLVSGVSLTATLRILIDILSVTGSASAWTQVADRVRHGGKLSDALARSDALPAMAIRMIKLGEETGQLPALAGRVAEFYEAKLQRSLDRIVGIVGPLAIVAISAVVGGLIVSVMTALLSVTQLVG